MTSAAGLLSCPQDVAFMPLLVTNDSDCGHRGKLGCWSSEAKEVSVAGVQ